MQPPLLAPPVTSSLNPRSAEFAENRAAMLEKLELIEQLHDEAEAGGGPQRHERLAKRGKLPVRERIALALDPDSPFLEISSLAGWGSDYPIGGGARGVDRHEAVRLAKKPQYPLCAVAVAVRWLAVLPAPLSGGALPRER